MKKRWRQKIIAPEKGPALSKLDVFRYYNNPTVQKNILRQIRDNDFIGIQSLAPDRHVLRRNFKPDENFKVTQNRKNPENKHDLAWFTERRFSEFHPTIGAKTKMVWVDLDPGKNKSYKDIVPYIPEVNKIVAKLPGVKKTEVAYSGGRGFYVKGLLDKPKDTVSLRKKLREALVPLAKEHKGLLTLRPPEKNQIRLDLTTLNNQGAIRALYSLNRETGRMSVPVRIKDLYTFDPKKDANPRAYMTDALPKRASVEFAPGIPADKVTHPIPDVTNKKWLLSVQEHNAARAGKHWDLRLVDPKTHQAHSWAIPKSAFPEPGAKPLLAIRTPTHTSRYALTFGEYKPKEIKKGYGKGSVFIKMKEPINILKADDKHVRFSKGDQQYLLFNSKGNSWLFRNVTNKEPSMNKAAFICGYHSMMQKLGMDSYRLPAEPNAPDALEPIQNAQESAPISELTGLLNQLPEADEYKFKPQVLNGVEGRLNRPANWAVPEQLPYELSKGPSPIIGNIR